MRRSHRTTAAALLALALVAAGCSKHASNDTTTSSTTPDRTSTTLVPRPAGYVALGDSYTAGGGAPPYDVDPSCARSSKGYPYALDAADDQVHLVANLACGGANIDQLVNPWPAHGLPAQIPDTPNPDVGLVTLTIGGNDAGLVQVIAACAQLDCSGVVGSEAADAKLSEVTGNLADKVYPALRKAYPNARLVQVSYADLTSTRLTKTCSWLASDEERVPNDAVQSVNDAIHAATRQSGQVEFLDVTHVFKGHELCSDDPWVNDVTAGLNALHPTAAGYVALGHAIATALQG
jgi:lysophospholipase L1-like esterase